MSGSIIVAGVDWWPTSFDVRNFRELGVHHFKGKRLNKITEVIVHESVTRSAADTIKVLRNRKPKPLGIHLVVTEDATVIQHADLLHKMGHAGPHNPCSVGIELTNPFYPHNLFKKGKRRQGLVWERIIEDAPWAHKGKYVLPTPAQAETNYQLVKWLVETDIEGVLEIPRVWRGYSDGDLAMHRVAGGKKRSPGIWAHTYWNHSDGAWLVLYAWLRDFGYEPSRAFEEAIRRATDVMSATVLTDYIIPDDEDEDDRYEPAHGLMEHD